MVLKLVNSSVEKEGASEVKIRSPTSGIVQPFLSPMYTWQEVEFKRTDFACSAKDSVILKYPEVFQLYSSGLH